MKQILSQFKSSFSRDRLFFVTCIFFLLTVISTFLGSAILCFSVPLIGEFSSFRIFLPITMILYLVWAFKGNDHPWRDASALEKWALVLAGILVVYGAVSLLRAQNLLFTFKRLFNLCFDVAFFFLLMRLCRHKSVLKAVIIAAIAGFFFLGSLGIYETFHEGIFADKYNHLHRVSWFFRYLQPPVVISGNTNDFCTSLVFLAAVFLLARVFGVFDKTSFWIRYAPAAIFPMLFFLITMADSRLNLFAFWILLAVTAIHDLLTLFSKKRMLVLTAFFLCCITFCHQYRQIVPPIQGFLTQAKNYYHYQIALREYYIQYGSFDISDGSAPPTPTIPDNFTDKTDQNTGNQNSGTLKDEFFTSDDEGNLTLNDTNSAGIRTLLLVHAGNCFRESYGLGVGLGNTEVYAAQRGVIPKWANNESISIHCFLARIIADFGIFVLIPLCAIVFLLLRKVWQMLVAAWKAKDNIIAAKALVLLGCCLIFPISSTASSDAQDILPMWLFWTILLFISETCCSKTSSDQ